MSFKPPSTGGGGGGFTNPMPSGTFLQTIDGSSNTIPLAGYDSGADAVLLGDTTIGNTVLVASSDAFSNFASYLAVANGGTAITVEDVVAGDNISQGLVLGSNSSETIFSTSSANAIGMQVVSGTESDLPANDDVLVRNVHSGNNDALSQTYYSEQVTKIVDATDTAEFGEYAIKVITNAVMTTYQTFASGAITSVALNQFNAKALTPDTTNVNAYLSLESDSIAGDYHLGLAGGTAVPSAESGYIRGCQFTKATAGDAEQYINVGDSTTSDFRRMINVDSNGNITTGDGTATNPFYSFSTSSTSGLLLAAANSPALASNGSVKLQINSNSNVQLNLPLTFGASTSPSTLTRGFGRGATSIDYNIRVNETHNFTQEGTTVFSISGVGERVKTTDSITASTTQTQGQEPLASAYNIVTTVANTDDTVTLPTAATGQVVRVKNEGANTLQVFPASGDSVNNGSVDASVTQATGTFYMYIADDATNWTRVQLTIA